VKEIKRKKQKWNTMINISRVRYKEGKCVDDNNTLLAACSMALGMAVFCQKERKPTSSLIIINIVGRINTYSR